MGSLSRAEYVPVILKEQPQTTNQQQTISTGATIVNLLRFDNHIISHRINIPVLVQVAYIMTMSLCILNESVTLGV